MEDNIVYGKYTEQTTGTTIFDEYGCNTYSETRYNMCAKRHVVAVVIGKSGRHYVGHNLCLNPQFNCPREIGEDYEKCKSICNQPHHAEPMAILEAGEDAKGGSIIVLNHERICDNCKEAIKEAGIIRATVLPLISKDNFYCLEK